MKICVLTPMWKQTLGGVSRYVEELACAYRILGHDVTVVTSDSGEGSIELGQRGPMLSAAALRTLMQIRPDVVHVHQKMSFVLPAVLYRCMNRRAKVAYTLHTQPAMKPLLPISPPRKIAYAGRDRWVAKTLLDACDVVTTVSPTVFANMAENCDIRPKNQRVVPSGVSMIGEMANREAARQQFDVQQRHPVLVSVGVLAWDCKVFGHQLCIESIRIIRERFPDAVLLIAGDGSEIYRRYLRDIVEKHGLENHVRFLGNVHSVSELLTAADVFMHLSPHEACPIAVLEAMAHGKPIVGVRSGGVPEIVTDGVTGLLVEPDASSAASAVMRLLDDPAGSRKIGHAAKVKAETDHSWTRIASTYITAFEELKQSGS